MGFPILIIIFKLSLVCQMSQRRPGHRTLQEAQQPVQRAGNCQVSLCLIKRVCLLLALPELFHFFFFVILMCVILLHSYMSIVESLPTYGVHYYAVKVQFYCTGFCFVFPLHLHVSTTHILVYSRTSDRPFGI